MASVLFGILRSGDAKGATVNASALRLTFVFRTREIPLGDIETVELKRGWWWGTVRIRHSSGEAAISGLSRADVMALATRIEAIRSVHERVAQLAEPQRYIARSLIRDLERDARVVAGEFPSRWLGTLATAPEVRMQRTILDFAKDPDLFRSRANKAFVEKELSRSRAFLDQVEARPLTDEQRRAVVVDESRNLVVAAAGSGKTSVIVAKAGWLVRGGYRRPSDLLLQALARDARNELEERIRKRLGNAVGNAIAVRTFYSLGMSIIGELEGRRPTLAREAEDPRALLGLLKGIVSDLLADRDLSGVLLKWFQGQFAPYRSELECRNWGEYWDYIRRLDIRSLKGEKVKSFEECEIANLLYHGPDFSALPRSR